MRKRTFISVRGFIYVALASLLASIATASEQIAALDAPAAMTAPNAVVEQPRPFGYFVGDVLTQRVLLGTQDRAFEPAELPRAERSGVWLERRPSSISSSADGRRWLVVQYQIINAPPELTTIALPALSIANAAGTDTLSIPAWPIGVAPLTEELKASDDALQMLRADRAAPRVALEPIRRQFVGLAAACVVALALWLGWLAWRNWRASESQPFARAWREVRNLDDRTPEAWQALHRAFDGTAGRVMQRATLPELFQQAPHFSSLRERIEQFYAQSNDLFFGSGLSANTLSVRQLCSELRRLEKRHER